MNFAEKESGNKFFKKRQKNIHFASADAKRITRQKIFFIAEPPVQLAVFPQSAAQLQPYQSLPA